MSTNLSKIYSKTPRNNTQPVIKPTETLKDDNKAANRVLAGMKIQNSHMRRLNIDGDIFDVPKMEYVHLLDKQVRDLKQENTELKQKMSKMENTINSMYATLKDLTNKITNSRMNFRPTSRKRGE